MKIQSLPDYLKGNAYPGRGIVIGETADGSHAVTAYFIMGRSVNSRNRVFVDEGDGIRTEAFDPSKMEDPSLIIYAPVRVFGDSGRFTIVTNGDQTDTVYDGLKNGFTFAESLRSRTFEPDAPNFTPRISGILSVSDGKFSYEMAMVKSAEGDPEGCERYLWSYEKPLCGEGRIIHTYMEDGDPLPSFEGEPVRVVIEDDIDTFTKEIWDALNEDNKVSLFVRFISMADGTYESRIVNKL